MENTLDSVIKIAIGVDSREVVAGVTAQNSILRRASRPVQFIPLALPTLRGMFNRDMPKLATTEFSFTRFLAPYLCGYDGWVIFMDGDVIVRDDIAKLWDIRDDKYAVMCVKHDHRPTETTKFLGQKQTQYEKKNWSSVMLMNAARCKALTPDYVNSASGLDLHRFRWLESEDLIGSLPEEWNHLVGWSEGELEDQKLLHWTQGGPYFSAYRDAKWADVWREENAAANSVQEGDYKKP